jgi:hypothetical protein
MLTMRSSALALALIAACSRGSLQQGSTSVDAGRDAAGGDVWLLPPIDARPPIDGGGPLIHCGSSTVRGGYRPFNTVMLLDQSVSGDPARWSGLLGVLADQIRDHAPRYDWALYTFPETGPACGQETATSTIDIPVTPFNGSLVAAIIRATTPTTGGSPTAAAIETGLAYLRTLASDEPKFLMLVTDAAPSCAGPVGRLVPDGTSAQTDALAAIAAARAEGVDTIVVAPSTPAAGDAAALNALAEAGNQARSQGDLKFFTEATLPELLLPGTDLVCGFTLASPPPAPGKVSMILNDDVEIPRDQTRTNGWDYDDQTFGSVTLYGDWCSLVMESRSYDIRVIFGCPLPD